MRDLARDLIAAFEEHMKRIPETVAPYSNSIAEPEKARAKRRYKREKKRRLEEIAVLDFETDPFDNTKPDEDVYPFLCVIYRNGHDPIVIWDDDHEALLLKVITTIETMEGRYTIYAHNGGRFDYKYLLKHLRGDIKFKGNSIMKAMVGEHELRDSLHILPTKLASLQKDEFDYTKMHRDVRHKHRDEIIQYCINDCKYALEFILHFVEKHGFKISIGQAAYGQVKELYPQIENLREGQDNIFRQFFFGGRVETFEGVLHYKGPLKYIDLNSAYPAVMAYVKHPIGKHWVKSTVITRDTHFIELSCYSRGALILRDVGDDGALRTRAPHGYHRFNTTIHEYRAAMDLGLLSDVTIHATHNCALSTAFPDFVIPRYDERRKITTQMKFEQEGSASWSHMNKDQTIIKFELNNAYGKFAQNPKRFFSTWITEVGKTPDPIEAGDGWKLSSISETYCLWRKPNEDFRYNNVATGASITGAQRAVLLRAIHAVERPLYCDTDSIICVDTGLLEMHDTKLGAWKIEAELDELIINGKKHYAYHNPTKKLKEGQTDLDRWTVRCKGASGITLEQVRAVNRADYIAIGERGILVKPKGITLYNDGRQEYIGRTVRQTAISERQEIERIREDGFPHWSRDPTMDAPISEIDRPTRS
jgi:hypothetical protein